MYTVYVFSILIACYGKCQQMQIHIIFHQTPTYFPFPENPANDVSRCPALCKKVSPHTVITSCLLYKKLLN